MTVFSHVRDLSGYPVSWTVAARGSASRPQSNKCPDFPFPSRYFSLAILTEFYWLSVYVTLVLVFGSQDVLLTMGLSLFLPFFSVFCRGLYRLMTVCVWPELVTFSECVARLAIQLYQVPSLPLVLAKTKEIYSWSRSEIIALCLLCCLWRMAWLVFWSGGTQAWLEIWYLHKTRRIIPQASGPHKF